MRDPFSSVSDRKQGSVFRGELLLCHHPLEGELHRVHLLCLPGCWDQRCVYHHAQQLAFFLNIFFFTSVEGGACMPERAHGGQRITYRSQVSPYTVRIPGITLRTAAMVESISEHYPLSALSAWFVFFMTSKAHSPLQLIFHHKIHI